MTFYEQYFNYQTEYSLKYGLDKTIVFIQKGDFYEAYATSDKGYNMFELSELLNITLTKTDKSKELSIKNPYCIGFPKIALQKYLYILTNGNYTVTIVDQYNDGILKKDICRKVSGIYSPGTYSDSTYNTESTNLLSLYIEEEKQLDNSIAYAIGISVIDLSTGKNVVYEIYNSLDEVLRFINIYEPKEIIISGKNNIDFEKIILYLEISNKKYIINKNINKLFFKLSYQQEYFNKIFGHIGMNSPIEYFNIDKNPYLIISYIILLEFANDHNPNIIHNILPLEKYDNGKYLILGNNAQQQLNIIDNCMLETKNRQFQSLFDVLNKTSTSIGKRFLKETLLNPIVSETELINRYELITKFLQYDNTSKNDTYLQIELYLQIESYLNDIVDLERYHRKMSIGTLHPHEFVNLVSSYNKIIQLALYLKTNNIVTNNNFNIDELYELKNDYMLKFDLEEMQKYNLNQIDKTFLLSNVNSDIDIIQNKIDLNNKFLEDMKIELEQYINDTKSGNKIYLNCSDKEYHFTLTKVRANKLQNILQTKKFIMIHSTKILYSDFNFKIQKSNVKLTCSKIDELSKTQFILLDSLQTLCKGTYIKIITGYYTKYNLLMQNIVNFVKYIDFIKSGAKVAKLYNYTRPTIINSDNGSIEATELRHPIVERLQTDTEYIPNDISLNQSGIILYGLNSSGKTVLMKAVGINIIMAQSGLFVSAKKFNYSIYTSLYARITGNDNIFKGLSSFALEMTELRLLLKGNNKSLIIGDEICRGTEQTSAISIVAATIITLSSSGSSFIFTSHIHELASIEEIKELNNVKCYHLKVDIDPNDNSLIFNRKLCLGQGPSVYGLHVAKYLLQNEPVIQIAEKIKNKLVGKELNNASISKYNSNLYVYECKICKMSKGQLDTHHINFQKDCTENFINGKEHIHKNDKCNLVVLCKECHNKVHANIIIIDGYHNTSTGIILKYKIKKNKLFD